jgi:hypothetical protein
MKWKTWTFNVYAANWNDKKGGFSDQMYRGKLC